MDVPLLLTAVSATSPCGEDMEYDAQFLQLERDAKGQPERSMGDSILPAEPPDWRSIQQQSLDLLQRSKDLRITHFLLQSSLALQGVAGLADVLTLINALLRPLLLLLTLPVTLLTLGLFILVVNGLLFWLAGSLLNGFSVDGFWPAALGSLLYSLISTLLTRALPARRH